MRILIVDDNQPLALGLASYFSDEGVESNIASSAEEAKQLFLQFAFDGAVVDFYLPGIDGASWIEWALSFSPSMPCILYTGSLTLSLVGRLSHLKLNPISVLRKTHHNAADLLKLFWKIVGLRTP